jgi:hypothetical protein
MPEESEQQAKLIKEFRALKTHEEKCEFLHRPENYPILARIYGPVHFPKPAVKSAVQTPTK